MKLVALASLLLTLTVAPAAAAGWPLAPIDQPHGVYGTFLNPGVAYEPGWAVYGKRGLRLESGDWAGYHLGIDIPVNDAFPSNAPPGTTHAVYAVEAGTVTESSSPDGGQLPETGCYILNGVWPWRTVVGRFIYGHIRPAVEVGEQVDVGQLIGWTCEGAWHLHLGEREGPGWDGNYVNPLRPGGPLELADRDAPRVVRYGFSENRLGVRGHFTASVLVGDRYLQQDWPDAPLADLHPWHLRFVLRRGERILSKQDVFAWVTPRPFREHYDLTRTMRTMPVRLCATNAYGEPGPSCQPALWVRAYTGDLPEGTYSLTTLAWDTAGNTAERAVGFRVTG